MTNGADGSDWDSNGAKTGGVTEFIVLYYKALLDGAQVATSLGYTTQAAAYTSHADTLLATEWGHMIAAGPDDTGTVWEGISSSGPPANGGGESLAHGWATSPIAALSGYVLGVQPVTAGFATWSVQPGAGNAQLGRGAGAHAIWRDRRRLGA